MQRCVIIGGGPIGDYERVRGYFSPEDYYIFCDSGLRHGERLQLTPDLIVGDFDSHPRPAETEAELITLPREKDDTDTFFAAKEGLARGFREFLLLGATGARLDHTLGNLSILLFLQKAGARGRIVDDYSEIELVEDRALVPETFPYFSLLCIDGPAEGVTVKNAKFPLDRAAITGDYQYGISNEVLPGKTAEITVEKGRLLLIKVVKD